MALTAAYALSLAITLRWTGAEVGVSVWESALIVMDGLLLPILFIPPFVVIVGFHWKFLRAWRGGRCGLRDLPSTWRRFRRERFTVGRWAVVAVGTGVLVVMYTVFQVYKPLIPEILPFHWDRTFMEWDAALHGGRHPWELLQPLLGRPGVTRFIDVLYWLWLPVTLAVSIWIPWHPDARDRLRFLWSFVLTWIVLGTLAAVLLSSAGPCYYTEVVGAADPYAGLFAYLESVDRIAPLRAVQTQEALWAAYQGGAGGPFAGISAMPSLHVGLALLYVFFGFRIRVWLGVLFSCYALVILLGSVHLGWHYAVDGYLGAAGAAGVWWISGRFVEGEALLEKRA